MRKSWDDIDTWGTEPIIWVKEVWSTLAKHCPMLVWDGTLALRGRFPSGMTIKRSKGKCKSQYGAFAAL
jgi:hypothetical protein